MTTYVYVCVSPQQVADAWALCRQHGCPDKQIIECPRGQVFAYEGDMEPLVDDPSATVVVGFV